MISNNLVMGIDPGNVKSGFIILNITTSEIINKGNFDNKDVVDVLNMTLLDRVHIERIESRNLSVGSSTLETCEWVGEFRTHCFYNTVPTYLHYPRHIRTYLTGRPNSNDKDIREVMLKIWGSGFKKVNSHEWLALAVLTYGEKTLEKNFDNVSLKAHLQPKRLKN